MAGKSGKRRRHRRGFAYALLCFVLVVALVIGCIYIFFRISAFEVRGNSRYSEREIVEALPIQEGENLLLIDKFAANRALFDAFPYLKSVKISRVWPSTVVVEVEEAQPVAYCLDDKGQIWLLDNTGKLLEKVSDIIAKDYPIAAGITPLSPVAGQVVSLGEGQADKLKALTELIAGLEAEGLMGLVTRLDIEQAYQLGFCYEDRFDVLMGMPVDIELKLRFFTAALGSMESYERGSFDVSQAPGKSIYFVPA